MSVDKVNYYTIDFIEKLGNRQPTQSQIDMVESILMLLDEPSLQFIFPAKSFEKNNAFELAILKKEKNYLKY